MATGKRPFEGDTTAALFDELLHATPPSPSSLNPHIPHALDNVINKALQKDRKDRYLSAKEFLANLKNLPEDPTARGASPQISIVVLPFEDISPDQDNEYFADGLMDEIISDLSAIRSLRVVSRTSAMRFKGAKKDVGTIGKELNVRYVLEGSVRKAGNKLRITAQLIDAPTDAHLWAKKFGGTLDDVFDIQETVSRAIVNSLQAELSPTEEARMAERPIPNVYAYECNLKARYEIAKWTEEGFDNALKHLQNGLDIVGDNAVLFAAMGYVYFSYINVGLGQYEDYRQKAEEFARKALELDSESPYGHLVLGHLQVWCESLTGGVRHLKRALAADPGNFDALFWLTIIYCLEGKADDAFVHADLIKKLEPLHPVNGSLPGRIHGFAGRFDLALVLLQKGFESHPEDFFTRWWYGTALAWNRRYEEAASVFKGIAQDDPNSLLPKVMLALAWSLRGRKSEALPVLESPEVVAWAKRDFNCALFVAEGYAPFGGTEKALDWLEHAVNIGFINYPFLSRHDPFLQNIRGEERFQKLMVRVKHEWEHFEA